MRWTSSLLALAVTLAACPDTGLWDETRLVPRDPDLEPPRVVSISLGELGAAPRGVSLLPVIEVSLSEPLDPATFGDDAVLLHDGAGELVTADAALDGASIRVEPPAPLAPRTEHRVVLAGTLRDLHGAPLAGAGGQAGPFEYTFVTGDETTGPPLASLIAPPEGASDVPRNVAEVVVGFSEAVFGRVRIGGYEGACQGTDRCVIAIPTPLEPIREYSVDASETRDAEGLAARGAPGFSTGRDLDAVAPALGPTPCTPSELGRGPACVTVRDVTMTVRLRTGEPASAFVETGGRRIDGAGAGAEHRIVVAGLVASVDTTFTVGAIDAAGNEARVQGLVVQTLPPLAPVLVTEVYADAAGAEPAQEFVEIFNSGRSDIVLEGFSVADSGGAGGAIAAGSVLGAGQYGLVVSDRFDPTSALDPPVAAGAPLFRVGSAIGTNGLLNAGEPVLLLDATGHELSRYPALLAPRSGVSAQRVSPDADEGDVESWAEDPETGATGGAANSTGG